jgi:hypothetical protein
MGKGKGKDSAAPPAPEQESEPEPEPEPELAAVAPAPSEDAMAAMAATMAATMATKMAETMAENIVLTNINKGKGAGGQGVGPPPAHIKGKAPTGVPLQPDGPPPDFIEKDGTFKKMPDGEEVEKLKAQVLQLQTQLHAANTQLEVANKKLEMSAKVQPGQTIAPDEAGPSQNPRAIQAGHPRPLPRPRLRQWTLKG